MTDTANCTKGAAALAGMLMASPALAHWQGLGILIFSPPIAAVMFVIAAAIVRCVFPRTRGKVYAAVTVLCLILWIPCFVFFSFALLDSHAFRNMTEMEIGFVMALLPIGAAFLLRLWHSRKQAVD